MSADTLHWNVDEMPRDGRAFYVRAVQVVRFRHYKPGSQQAKRGDIGRWQQMNEYGGWENCPAPLGNEWTLENPFGLVKP